MDSGVDRRTKSNELLYYHNHSKSLNIKSNKSSLLERDGDPSYSPEIPMGTGIAAISGRLGSNDWQLEN